LKIDAFAKNYFVIPLSKLSNIHFMITMHIKWELSEHLKSLFILI